MLEVAVLGAGGFIGRYAMRALEKLPLHLRIHTSPEQFDITDEAALCAFIDGAGVVVHLAGPPSVALSFERSAEYVRVHAGGTAAVLHAMRITGVRRIVYVSSAEVYGMPAVQPVDETAAFMPRSPYGAAKAAAELLIQAAYRAGNLDGFVLRPFSVYGAGMSDHSLIGSLVRQAENSTDLFVADERPVRDYVYAADVGRAIALCTMERRRGVETLNVCSGEGTTIVSIVQMLSQILERPLTLHQRGNGRGSSEIFRLTGNPRKAVVMLDWHATTTMREGLAGMTAPLTSIA